jgi:hypothetical protein
MKEKFRKLVPTSFKTMIITGSVNTPAVATNPRDILRKYGYNRHCELMILFICCCSGLRCIGSRL